MKNTYWGADLLEGKEIERSEIEGNNYESAKNSIYR
jgi:hypothetical protein